MRSWESDAPGANMGGVSRKKVEEFWGYVKSELALSTNFEWTLAEPSMYTPRTIIIRESIIGHYPWEAYQEVLHEVAHAESEGHGQSFHRRFAELVGQFLGKGG
jgi:hypothetical protein